MNKTILITGSNGFIGKNLSNYLSDKYNVVSLNRTKLNLLDKQSVDNLFDTQKFDIIIHTATYDAAPEFTTNDPNKVLENNLVMFDNLAQHSDKYNAMLYFGSGAEKRREGQYGLSKYYMDQAAQNSNNIFNLRLYSVYGIGTDWRYRFINNACAKVANNMPITIPKINKCDYLNVKDLCKIVDFYVNNFKIISKSNDICSGDFILPDEIISVIKQVVHTSHIEIKYHNTVSSSVSRAKSSDKEYSGDPTFVKSLPIDMTSLYDGIEELINFYSNKQINLKEFVY